MRAKTVISVIAAIIALAAPVRANVYFSDPHVIEKKKKIIQPKEIPPDILWEALELPMGDIGRLVIPELGINVRVYYAQCYEEEENQAITDLPDTAIWQDYSMEYGSDSQPLLADHWNQGFVNLHYAVPGETAAYIVQPNGGVKTYRCVKRDYGHNDEHCIFDEDGYLAPRQNRGGICMYTCNGSWQDVIFTYWQPE